MAIEGRMEALRGELVGYCYRMLGSPFEAEDAVQETLVRAWRRADRFDEGRGALRSWLYAIATNVCVDMVRGAQRRARAMDLGPASSPGAPLGDPLPEHRWVLPIADPADPAELAQQRETIRLAFVAALQRLPPRQRAILLLRDVVCWSASEVATLLDTTVASVNSALQRARATLASADLRPHDLYAPDDPARQRLLQRYCDAFERYDVDALVALLRHDATMSMPPFPWWLRGRQDIRRVMHAAGHPCEGARLLPTSANGQPAFAQYRPIDGGAYGPFALVVLDLSHGEIAATTTYLDARRLFPILGLPMSPRFPIRTGG